MQKRYMRSSVFFQSLIKKIRVNIPSKIEGPKYLEVLMYKMYGAENVKKTADNRDI